MDNQDSYSSFHSYFSLEYIKQISRQYGSKLVVFILILKVVSVIAIIVIGGSYVHGISGSKDQMTILNAQKNIIDAGLNNHLRQKIHLSSIKSRAAGYLSSFDLHFRTQFDSILRFVVFYEKDSNKVDSSSEYFKSLEDKKSQSTQDDPLSIDLIPNLMVVSNYLVEKARYTPRTESAPKIPNFSYSVVLNKFNSIKDHCLIVSDQFLPQSNALLPYELGLLYYIIASELRGVAFYNSDAVAGASQPHRHFQFIPLDELWRFRNPDDLNPLPLDDLLLPRIDAGTFIPFPLQKNRRDGKLCTYTIPEFPFRHAVVALASRDRLLAQQGITETQIREYLFEAYVSLLRHIQVDLTREAQICFSQSVDFLDTLDQQSNNPSSGLDDHLNCWQKFSRQLPSYNLIMTPRYMMIVLREKREAFSRIGINCLAYLGFLLAKDPINDKLIREKGPLAALIDAAA